jgi:hypothetical protein
MTLIGGRALGGVFDVRGRGTARANTQATIAKFLVLQYYSRWPQRTRR